MARKDDPKSGTWGHDQCDISNIPPALQSCETLPEGWPCLSMDSAQIAAVGIARPGHTRAARSNRRRMPAARIASNQLAGG